MEKWQELLKQFTYSDGNGNILTDSDAERVALMAYVGGMQSMVKIMEEWKESDSLTIGDLIENMNDHLNSMLSKTKYHVNFTIEPDLTKEG